jgi:hypothetical protein
MDLRATGVLLLAVCSPPLDCLCGGSGFRLIFFVIARFVACLATTRATAIPYRSTITLIATAAGATMSNHPSYFIDTHAAANNGHDNDANADSTQ